MFAGGLAVCRALGIPCRSITTFKAGIDKDLSMTIDVPRSWSNPGNASYDSEWCVTSLALSAAATCHKTSSPRFMSCTGVFKQCKLYMMLSLLTGTTTCGTKRGSGGRICPTVTTAGRSSTPVRKIT